MTERSPTWLLNVLLHIIHERAVPPADPQDQDAVIARGRRIDRLVEEAERLILDTAAQAAAGKTATDHAALAIDLASLIPVGNA